MIFVVVVMVACWLYVEFKCYRVASVLLGVASLVAITIAGYGLGEVSVERKLGVYQRCVEGVVEAVGRGDTNRVFEAVAAYNHAVTTDSKSEAAFQMYRVFVPAQIR
jgi:hypothetical protein